MLEVYSLAVVEADLAPLHHVHQASRCSHQQVTASLQVSDLLANVSPSVHHTRTHTGPVCKLQQERGVEEGEYRVQRWREKREGEYRVQRARGGIQGTESERGNTGYRERRQGKGQERREKGEHKQ
jgi:hypothetical protein